MSKKKTTASPEMKVSVCCTGSDALGIEEFVPFQGAFKSLSDKNYKRFKTQLLEIGIAAASTVWKKDGKNYLLDGNQRLETLIRMQEEGYEIPKIPVNYTECADEMDARRKVMALASTYGEVSESSLKDFADLAGLDMASAEIRFNFPEVDLSALVNGEVASKPEKAHAKKASSLLHTCPNCGTEFKTVKK